MKKKIKMKIMQIFVKRPCQTSSSTSQSKDSCSIFKNRIYREKRNITKCDQSDTYTEFFIYLLFFLLSIFFTFRYVHDDNEFLNVALKHRLVRVCEGMD